MKIALSGISGSGKSTVAEYLTAKYGFKLCSPGSICRKVTHVIFGTSDKTSLNAVDTAIRAIDPNAWVKASLQGVSESSIVIDGARYISNYEYLLTLGFQFWKIELSPQVAQDRLKARGQIFDNRIDASYVGEHEFNQFPFKHVLTNHGDVAELLKQVDQVLSNAQHSP